MKTIGIMLGGILAIALVAREYNWRVRGLLFAALIALTIILVR